MPAQSSSVSEQLINLVHLLDQTSSSFSALQAHFGEQAESVGDTQFNVQNLSEAIELAIFANEPSSDKLSHIDISLQEGQSTSVKELGETFGEYRIPPMIRRGAHSVLFTYQSSDSGTSYTIIVKATEPITDETGIQQLSIRID